MPTEHHASFVPSGAPRLSRSAVLASVVLTVTLALLGLLYWLGQAWPVAVVEAADARLQCLSYAPFRRPGESPFDERMVVPEARLREDFALLAARSDCVRTYSVAQGLDQVPRLAREAGMHVYLGVWLGRDRAANELEIDAAIRVARAHPDDVRAVIVGNEVLLRRELPADEIARQLDRVRAAVPQRITYADVWEFWQQHPELASHVDFATIHILPYWEDEPVSIGAAIHHVVDIAASMRQRLGGLPVLIGETGWPSAGRSRRDAVPGRVNQTRFLREFTHAAQANGLQYNFIEGFDQPWKRALEGAMGGAWGLFSSDGSGKFPASGAVREDARSTRGFVSMLGGAVLAVALAWLALRRNGGSSVPGGRSAQLSAACFGAACAAALAAQVSYLWVWNRYVWEWVPTLLWTLQAAALAALAVPLAVGRIASRTPRGRPVPEPFPSAGAGRGPAAAAAAGSGAASAGVPDDGSVRSVSADVVVPPFSAWLQPGQIARWHGAGRIAPSRSQTSLAALSALRLAWLAGLAAVVLLHVFDARYRGFPVALFSVPLCAFAWLAVCGYRFDRIGREEWLMGVLVVAGSVLRLIAEGWRNVESITFFALAITLAVLAVGGRWRLPPAGAPGLPPERAAPPPGSAESESSARPAGARGAGEPQPAR